MNKLGHYIYKFLEVLMVINLVSLSVLIIVNVFLRFAFHSGIVVSEEVSRFFYIWTVYIGSIVVLVEKGHVYVDFIRKAMPAKVQWTIELLCDFAMLYCCYVFFDGAVDLTELNMIDHSPVAEIPMGYVYSAGVVSSVGMGVVFVIRIVKRFMALSAPAETKAA